MSGTAAAQYLAAHPSLVRAETLPAARIAVELAPSPSRADDSSAKRIFIESRADDPTAFSSQILARLPIDYLERLLKKNLALRVAEAAIGAAIVGYQVRRDPGSPVAQIGVHAIRFGGAEWLERSRFRVEPQVTRHGFAIYVTKNNGTGVRIP